VQEFILSVARTAGKGHRRRRMDVPFCVEDDAFWQAFRGGRSSRPTEAYITGEIPGWPALVQGDQFVG
jgi:hypothetical protein